MVIFTGTPPLEALQSLLICATIEELSNDVGQPVAWTELMLLMLRKMFVEPLAEACTDRSKV